MLTSIYLAKNGQGSPWLEQRALRFHNVFKVVIEAVEDRVRDWLQLAPDVVFIINL